MSARRGSTASTFALIHYEPRFDLFSAHILAASGRRIAGSVSKHRADLSRWTRTNFPRSRTLPTRGRCPICGEATRIVDRTLDSRLIASCGDAFTLTQWRAAR